MKTFTGRWRYALSTRLPGVESERFFHTCPVASGFGSHVSDNNPEVLHKEKTKYVEKKHTSSIKSVPGWDEQLASDSEAVVKAERDCETSDFNELQKETVEYLKSEKTEEEHFDVPPDDDALKRDTYPL